jgi:histidinol-phosphatase (PHP family)
MRWTNYHSHSHFSDGKFAPELYIESAIAQNLLAYGVSDHGPHPFSGNGNLTYEGVENYVETIYQLKAKYSDAIQLYCGMEVDYIPSYMGVSHPTIQASNLDYTICSVHHAGFYEDGKIFGIDNSAAGLEKGIREIYAGDVQAMVERYYELTRTMLQTDKPDILGHLDRIKKNNQHQSFFSEQSSWYREAIEATVDVIAASGVIVEVNTKSYYKSYTQEPDPSYWILEMLHQRQVPIQLSSDTHHPDDITKSFETVRDRLVQIGFRTQRIFLDGIWKEVSLIE